MPRPKNQTTAAETPAAVVVARAAAKRSLILERRATAASCIGQIPEGEGLTVLTHGQFSLIDVLDHLIHLSAPCALAVSTWAGNAREYQVLIDHHRAGRLTGARFLLDRSTYTREAEACELLVSHFGRDAIRTTRNHCKIALVGPYAMRSSMNLNMNPRIENLDIDHSPQMAAFLASFFDYCWRSLDATDWRGGLPDGSTPREFNADSADVFDQVCASLAMA